MVTWTGGEGADGPAARIGSGEAWGDAARTGSSEGNWTGGEGGADEPTS